MMLIGHRGLAGLAPENTLASFAAAADHGLAMVEFDVRLSRDGVPVVFHDDTLERTTDGAGAVAERDWAELASLDAGSWFAAAWAGERVPGLEQVLRLCLARGLAVNMEIKPDAGRRRETARAALALALRLWPGNAPPPVVSSFETECIEAALDAAPHWPRALLAETLPQDWDAEAHRLGLAAFHLDHARLSGAETAALHAKKLVLRAYTVNDSKRAATLANWGVDGVFSDFPRSS
jgi:glycerophosphoryl diester phosphodiesterase